METDKPVKTIRENPETGEMKKSNFSGPKRIDKIKKP